MKRILLIAAALSFAVCANIGCKNRNKTQEQQTEITDPHAGHSHAPGESCPSETDHAGHNHAAGETCGNDTHESQDHTGHDHSDHSHDSHAGHSHDSHAGHSHGANETVAEDPDEIVFPAAQAARTEFEVRKATRGEFRETISCGGQIKASQSEIAVVTAPISGVVTFVDGRVMANSSVTSGQSLFRLSSQGLASGDAVAKAAIAFRQAEADFERIKTLYADQLVTQRDYLAAEAEYLRAKAEYDPVKNTDNRGGTIVSAPSTGYVMQMSVAPGDFVEMGQPLATIARSGRMQLQALVSQRYFDRLPFITDANFKAPSSDKYYTVSELGGKLYTAGRIVSGSSTLIPVVFEFNGVGLFPDGAYTEVVLLGRKRENVLTLPLTAITEQQGLYYVYIQLDADCYKRQEVWLGANDGINVEIVKGLSGGEMIVTKGAINVKMASASEAIPHGHSH